MALTTTYNTGTATINANEVAVTGQGTTWLTSGLQSGDMFMAAGLSVPIAAVNSNTSITLSDPWPGASRAAASYRVQFTPDATRVLASTRAVLDALTNGVLYAIAGLQTAADKIAYFTGQGTAALTSFTSFARSLLGSADAATARATLQLGSAATMNTGTSGAAVPRLDASNTWSASQKSTSSQPLVVDTATVTDRLIRFSTASSLRWDINVSGDTESGGNAGSMLAFQCYNDSGVWIGRALTIDRATRTMFLATPLPLSSGGTGGNTPAAARAGLGLGSAALESIGTSGNAIGKLNTFNTWSASQLIATTAYAQFELSAGAGANSSVLVGSRSGSRRWTIELPTSQTETGGNAGSDFAISRHNDAGSWLDAPIVIARASGVASFSAPPKLPSFTVSTLPSAVANPAGIAFVSNGTSSKRLAISDGTSWRFPDGAIVS